MTKIRAAIDIGSNTIRMLIAAPASPDSDTPWRRIAQTQKITRLAQGLHVSGRLHEDGIKRSLEAMAEFSHILRRRGVTPEHVRAVATAAVREARNGDDFIQRCEKATGILPRIIEGRTEARLSLAGAAAVLRPETRKHMLLFDIGGGSTEFIRAKNTMVLDATSRKLGVVRLVEAHLATDPPAPDDYRAMLATVETHLDTVETGWDHASPPPSLVGTAGTITTLAAIHMDLFPYDADRVNNHVIPWDEFLALRDRLLAMTHVGRSTLPSIEYGREDLIIAGLAITEAIMRRWHYRQLVSVDTGLLEGVWLAMIGNPESKADKS